MKSDISNILQLDGIDCSANSFVSSSDESTEDESSDMTIYSTDDEIDPDSDPICISPAVKPNKRKLKVLKASSLPLIALMNARSLYNKAGNFKKFMTELGIEAAIVSETWEREDQPLDKLLDLRNYKIHSHRRTKVKANRQPGGACALVYNENRFEVTNLDIHIPKGVEACWSVFKPKTVLTSFSTLQLHQSMSAKNQSTRRPILITLSIQFTYCGQSMTTKLIT